MRRSLACLVTVALTVVGLGLSAEHVNAVTAFFPYTGSAQNFVVPEGVTEVAIVAYGAGGGRSTSVEGAHFGAGGLGARASVSDVTVSPGETLKVFVGGRGLDGDPGVDGGFNGGGNGGNWSGFAGSVSGGGGGGASDVRRAPYTEADRIVVAAGGGGASSNGDGSVVANGGDGGGSGSAGASPIGGASGGAGGAGGAAGPGGFAGTAATGGVGGDGGGTTADPGATAGGGGGGGNVGGGGGGSSCCSGTGGGGGGGSSTGSVVDAINAADGSIVFSYEIHKPDAQIRVAGKPTFTGNDVYTGEQKVSKTRGKNKTTTFEVLIENDGTGDEYFSVQGTPGDTKFTATYRSGATDITADVTTTGFFTSLVPPGGSELITLEVTGLKNDRKKSFDITIDTSGITDSVTAVAKTR
jgi:hypothetical protein